MKVAASSLLLTLAGAVSAFMPSFPGAAVSSTQLEERRTFITGNWKLNPSTKQEALDLATGIAGAVKPDSPCDVALFVPFPFIEPVQKVAGDKLKVGAEVRYKLLRYCGYCSLTLQSSVVEICSHLMGIFLFLDSTCMPMCPYCFF